MKRKIWANLLACVMARCLTFGLAACGEKGGPAEPNGGSSPTLDGGPGGNQEEPDGGSSDDDQKKPDGSSDDNEDPPDDGSDDVIQGGEETCEHTFTVGNTCSKCGGVWKYTEGLLYTVDEETNTCSVRGVGTASGKIIIPYGYEGKFVTRIGNSAFSHCEALTGIVIPDSVTSIGRNAFEYCNELTRIVIPDSVTSIEWWAFFECSGLTGEVNIPDSVTKIEDSAFYGCEALTSVKIGSGVASIGSYAFMDCNKLESLTVSDGNQNYSSEDGILYNKTKTKIICAPTAKGAFTILDSVTELEIGAFADCSELTSVTIPNGMTEIAGCAFIRCRNLTNIQFRGTAAEWEDLPKYIFWDNGTGDYTVTCTDGTIAKDGTVTMFTN